jgi:hypothetical protein
MQVILRKVGYSARGRVGYTIRRSHSISTILETPIEKMVFNFTAPRIKENVLLHSKLGGSPVFCIVHYNAPDFLLLNVNQIECLYPDSKIYVLDNGSQQANTNAVKKGLKRFNNITLFAAPNWAARIGVGRLLYSHTKGLQFLLNYAAEQRDEIAVFLDQDCILSNNIDDLFAKLGRNVILIGTRYGRTDNLVHASFMILQPKRINQLFGNFSFFHERTASPHKTGHQFLEPYHGLSVKAEGKLLFLEFKPYDEIPWIASYSYQGKTYAWHAGASSVTAGNSAKDSLDGRSDPFYGIARNLAFEHMKRIHEETINRRLTTGNG